MTVRTCPSCGLEEQRGVDAGGRPTVNLDPTTGLCVNCTVTAAMGPKSFPLEPAPFDGRAAAAGMDKD